VKRISLLSFALLAFASCGGGDGGADVEVAVPVSVEELIPGSIEEFITATGTVDASMEVTISAETGGEYVLLDNPSTGRPFALSDIVPKGTKIIRIKNQEQENTIGINSRRLTLETTRLEYEQQKSLFDKGGVTRLDLSQAERSFIDAQYAYENAVISLAKLSITAPFKGVITSLPYYSRGVDVAQGVELVSLMEYSSLLLEVSLPGKELGRVAAGQPVRITNYTLPEDTLSGTVTQVSPALDSASRSFKAMIEVGNPELKLRPGMFVKAEIVVARSDSAIVIPKDVIQVKQRGKTVFIVQKGAAQERLITTGLENPGWVEVLEGLEANDRLVVRGFETLRNRSKVKVVR
jgi:membrane fusion protein (multidrug efflux system)